jgi:hypothetical protein
MMVKPTSYWKWFFQGKTDKPGWRRLIDRWLILHTAVGVGAAWIVPTQLPDAAKAVLLPLAGILIGMSFAWVGNAVALAQSAELERLADQQADGIEAYVYTFQTAILILLVSLTLWGAAGLGVFDKPCPWNCGPWPYRAISAVLYLAASMAIRECWQVVLLAQVMLVYQRAISRLPQKPPSGE